MKKYRPIILFVFALLTGCDNKSEEKSSTNTFGKDGFTTLIKKSKTDSEIKIPGSIKTFQVDHYPVSDQMLSQQRSDEHATFKLKSGKTIAFDKVWFSNDSTKQVLVLELYTDYHRLETFHFYSNDIPEDLIEKMTLHTDEGELSEEYQKRRDFNGFVHQSKKISSS